jgi:formate hydrogenlyase transcriptional activator
MRHMDKLGDSPAAVKSIDVDTLLAQVVDALPVGTMLLDQHDFIRSANREAERCFGYVRNQLEGMPVALVVAPPLHDLQHSPGKNDRAAPQTTMDSGVRMVALHSDGTEFPIEVGLHPIEVDSRLFKVVSVLDVTERMRAEETGRNAAQDLLSFESLVSEISARFVNLPPEALDAAIVDALHQIVDALDLDRAVMWLRGEENDDFYPRQRWLRDSVPDYSDRLCVRELFPWFWERIGAGDVAAFARVSDIPDALTRANMTRYGAVAGATIAFSIEGAAAGCVTFATTRQERQWPEAEIGRLRLVTRVFANAISRQRNDKALAAALSQIQQLSERLKDENAYLRSEVAQVIGSCPVVGQSPAILQALDMVKLVASTDSTVLLLGETGTGKEMFASHLHDQSSRRHRLMVRVSCAAIPDTLLEGELFGREKGAYTGALTRQTGRFELADKSTIFLDEIGDLPLDVQVKLLRVLEDRQVQRLGSSRSIHVDVRIVAATHRNLEEMVAAGTFREDLFYRLNVFPVRVPSLRDRPADIPLLVNKFVDEFSKRFGKPVSSVDKESLSELQRHTWPGNVRELRNVIERAMIVAQPGTRLLIPLTPGAFTPPAARSPRLVDVETAHMRSVLEGCGWRIRGVGGAAEQLGLKPSTLETRLAKLSIRRPIKSS